MEVKLKIFRDNRFEKFDKILISNSTPEQYVSDLAKQQGATDLKMFLGLQQIMSENLYAAKRLFEEASDYIGGCPQTLHNLGRLCLDMNNPDEAMDHFLHAIKLEPEFILAIFNAAYGYLDRFENMQRKGYPSPAQTNQVIDKNLQQAKNLLLEAIAIFPEYVSVYTGLWGIFINLGLDNEAERAFKQIKNLDQEYANKLAQRSLNKKNMNTSVFQLYLGEDDPYLGREERLGDTDLLMKAQFIRYEAINYFLVEKGKSKLSHTQEGEWEIDSNGALHFQSYNSAMGNFICRRLPLKSSANDVGDLELGWLSPRFRVAVATKGFIASTEIIKVYDKAKLAVVNHHVALKLSANPKIRVIQPRGVPLPWGKGKLGFNQLGEKEINKWLLSFRKVQGPTLEMFFQALLNSQWDQNLCQIIAKELIQKHIIDLFEFRKLNLKIIENFKELYEIRRVLIRSWEYLYNYAKSGSLPKATTDKLINIGDRLENLANVPYRDAAPWNAVLDAVRLDLDLRQDWLPKSMANLDFSSLENTIEWVNSLKSQFENRKLSNVEIGKLFARWLVQLDFDQSYKIVPSHFDLILILESFHLESFLESLTLDLENMYFLDKNSNDWKELSFFVHSNLAYHNLNKLTDPIQNSRAEYHIRRIYQALTNLASIQSMQNLKDNKTTIIESLNLINNLY